MKAYGGVNVYIHNFLTSALAEAEWSALCPDRFTPRERVAGTYFMWDWVDPRTGLDDLEKRKSSQDSNSNPSVVQPVVSHYTDYAILSLLNQGKSVYIWKVN
jgi:hypothetical protein